MEFDESCCMEFVVYIKFSLHEIEQVLISIRLVDSLATPGQNSMSYLKISFTLRELTKVNISYESGFDEN